MAKDCPSHLHDEQSNRHSSGDTQLLAVLVFRVQVMSVSTGRSDKNADVAQTWTQQQLTNFHDAHVSFLGYPDTVLQIQRTARQ